MTSYEIASLTAAIASLIAAIISIYQKSPGTSLKWTKRILEALAEGIPFGLIHYHLAIAIIAFTGIRLYNIIKEGLKPNLKPFDVVWIIALCCIQVGIFAATAAWIKT